MALRRRTGEARRLQSSPTRKFSASWQSYALPMPHPGRMSERSGCAARYVGGPRVAGNAPLHQRRVQHEFRGAAGVSPDRESQGVMEQFGDSCLVLVPQTEGGEQISLPSTLNQEYQDELVHLPWIVFLWFHHSFWRSRRNPNHPRSPPSPRHLQVLFSFREAIPIHTQCVPTQW